ncbi:hypothetical protein V6N13_042639 [Hibiscus sabdariffa]
MEETKVFRTSLINFLCFQFPSVAAFFSTPPTVEQPAPATAQPTPPTDPSEGADNTEQLNLSAEDIFDWHTPMEHQSQLKEADILGSSKANEDAPAPAEPPVKKRKHPKTQRENACQTGRPQRPFLQPKTTRATTCHAAEEDAKVQYLDYIIWQEKKRTTLQGIHDPRILPKPRFPARSDQPRQISFILDSQYLLHSSLGEKFVERKIYLFGIERVKLKKRMNAVHVRDQKHELTPSRNRGDSFSAEGYRVQARQTVTGLRDKSITQQGALPKSENQPRYLPGQDPLSLLRHPLCHPA